MAQVTQEYLVKITAQGLKEVTREIRGLRKDLGGIDKGTTAAQKGFQKVSKSAGEYDRNIKGAANATNNGTKAFSKMSQGMQGTLVPAYATVAANVFALTAAFGALERAADTQTLIKASEELAVQTGRNLSTVAKSMKEITDGAISMKEGLTQASIAASAGFDNTTIERLTQVARNASVALGRDLTDSLNRVFKGAIKAEPELLDELGIILRLDPATRAYAASLGKAVTELTTFEKQQAVVNAVLEQGEEKFGKLTDVAVNPYTKLSAAFQDVITNILKFVNIGISPFINLLADNIYLLTGAFLVFGNTVAKRALPILQEMGYFLQNDLSVRVAEFFQELERGKVGEQFFSGVEDDIYSLEGAFKGTLSSMAVALEETSDVLPKGLGDQINSILNDKTITDKETRVAKAFDAIDTSAERLAITLEGNSVELAKKNAALNVLRASLDGYAKGVDKVNNKNTLLHRSLSLVNTAFKTTKATIEATKLSLVSGFFSGTNDGILKLLPNIKKFNNLLTENGLKSTAAGKALRAFSIGVFGISGAVGSFIKFIPILGTLTIAWQLLGGAVGFVFNLFRDEDSIEKTNKALESQSTALKSAEKSVKNYNREIKTTPDTLDNVNEQLETQKNILTELNSANNELLENTEGFGQFFGSDLEDLTDNLNKQLDVLKELGRQDQVNRFLREFGENGKIVEETAIKAANAIREMINASSEDINEALDANKKLEESIEAVNSASKSYIDTVTKLDTNEAFALNLSNAITAIQSIDENDIEKKISAIKKFSTEFAGSASITAVQDIENITAASRLLKEGLEEIEKEIYDYQEAIKELPNSVYSKPLEEQYQNKIAALEESLQLSREYLRREEELLRDLGDTAEEELKRYLDSLLGVINAQSSFAAQRRSLDFQLIIPGLSELDQLKVKSQIADVQLNQLALTAQFAKEAFEGMSTKLNPKQLEVLDKYDRNKAGERTLIPADELPILKEAKKLREQINAEELKFKLLGIDINDKVWKIRLKLFTDYLDRYNKAVKEGDTSQAANILSELSPQLDVLLKSINLLPEGFEDSKTKVQDLLVIFQRYAEWIAYTESISNKQLKNELESLRLKKEALGTQRSITRNYVSDIDNRINKESELSRIFYEQQMLQAQVASNKAQAGGADQKLLDKYKERYDLFEDLAEEAAAVGDALILNTLAKENLLLDIQNKRIDNELSGASRVSKARQATYNLWAKLEEQISRVGPFDKLSDEAFKELDENLDKLTKEWQNKIKIDINTDFSDSIDDISNFSDIMQELKDRIDALNGSDPFAGIKAGLVAISQIAEESGQQIAISFSSLTNALVDFSEAVKGTDKLGASLQFASQALSSLSQGMEEGSSAAKALQVANIALATTDAVLTILKQGKEGDSYTAFARMAAAAAIVTGVLSAAGIAFGGSTGGGGATAGEDYTASFGEDRIRGQEFQTNALVDSLDNLTTINDALYGAEKELRKAIVALKKSFDSIGKETFDIGGTFDAGELSRRFNVAFGSNVSGGFFSTETITQDLLAAGLRLSSSVKFVADDFVTKINDARLFIVKQITEVDSGFFGFGASSDTYLKSKSFPSSNPLVAALEESLENSFEVLTGLFDSFGSSIATYFENYSIDLDVTEINLTGLSATEQAEAIARYFSGVINTVLADAVPWLEKFRNAGEELADTLIRLVNAQLVLDNALSILDSSVRDIVGPTVDTSKDAYKEYKAEVAIAIDWAKDQKRSINKLNDILSTTFPIFNRDKVVSLVLEYDNTVSTINQATRRIVEILAEGGRNLDAALDLTEFRLLQDYYRDYGDDLSQEIANMSAASFSIWVKRTLDEVAAEWISALEDATGLAVDGIAQAFETFAEVAFSSDELEKIAIRQAEDAITQSKSILLGIFEGNDLITDLINEIDPGDISSKFDLGVLYTELEKTGEFASKLGPEIWDLVVVTMGGAFNQLNDIIGDTEDSVEDLLQSLQRQIDLFGLVGKQLDLVQFKFDLEDAIEEAGSSAEAIAQTEILYGLKRLEITKIYNDLITEEFTSLLDTIANDIFELERTLEGFDEIGYYTQKLDDLWKEFKDSFKLDEITFEDAQALYEEQVEVFEKVLDFTDIVTGLESQLTVAKSAVKEFTLESLNAQLDTVRIEIKDTKAAIEDKQEKLLKTQNALDILLNDNIDDITRAIDIDAKSTRIDKLETKIASLKETLKLARKYKRSLLDSIENFDEQRAALKAAVSKIKEDLQENKDLLNIEEGNLIFGDPSEILASAQYSTDVQLSLLDEIRQATLDKYNAELEAVQEIESLAIDIKGYLKDLAFSDISPLTAMEKLTEAQGNFSYNLSNLFDEAGNLNTDIASDLLSSADTLLDNASKTFSIGPEFQEIYDYVVKSLSGVDATLNDEVTKGDVEALTEAVIGDLRIIEQTIREVQDFSDELFVTEIESIGLILSSTTEGLPAIVEKLNSLDAGWQAIGAILDNVPSLDTGTDEVKFDQLAKIHKGEMIINPETSEEVRQGGAIITNIDNTSSINASNDDIVEAINTLTDALLLTQEELLDQGEVMIKTSSESESITPTATTLGII